MALPFRPYAMVYGGKINQGNYTFDYSINAGSWVTISSDTTVYYGDIEQLLTDLFLETVWIEDDH